MAGSERQSILLVDDDSQLLGIIATFFRKGGHVVHTACNGLEALDIMRASGDDIGLVITDIEMPLLHGPALAAAIGLTRPHLPLIFVSGRHRDAIQTEPPLPDEATFLQKPYSLEELSELVRDALASNQSLAQ